MSRPQVRNEPVPFVLSLSKDGTLGPISVGYFEVINNRLLAFTR